MCKPKTAVLLRHVGIGDLIWHIPYIRALAQSSLNGKVTVIAAPSTLADKILATEGCVEQVMLYDRNRRRHDGKGEHRGFRGLIEFSRRVRSQAFDRIYLFSNRYHHGILAWLARIPLRAGYGRGLFQRLFLNHPPYLRSYSGPAVPQYEDAVTFGLAHGLVAGHQIPKLQIPATDAAHGRAALSGIAHPVVALVVGSSQTSKHWGDANYGQLTRMLVESRVSVAVVGGASERARVDGIVAAVPAAYRQRVIAFCDQPILAVAGILKAANLCVGNDTGALNMAAAVDTPCVCVLGHRPVLMHDPLIQCMRAEQLSDITPAQVLQTILQRLDGKTETGEIGIAA